jgi:hypothetical protein
MGKRRYHHGRYPVLKSSSMGVVSEEDMQKAWLQDRRLTDEFKDHVDWLCESCHTPTKHKGDCVLNNSKSKKKAKQKDSVVDGDVATSATAKHERPGRAAKDKCR